MWKLLSGTLLLLLLLPGQPSYADLPPEKKAVLENGKLRGVIEIGNDGLLKEKYYILSPKGKWVLVLSQFTPLYDIKDTASTQLWNTDLNPYRFLLQKMKANRLIRKQHGDTQTAVIELEQNGNFFTQEISLRRGETFFHVEVSGTLQEDQPDLDYLLSAYTFNYNGAPSFVHTPGLKFDDPRSGKGRDQILGDRAFHSPAIVLQQDSLFAAMVPDLKIANERRVLSYDARQTVLFKPSADFLLLAPANYRSMPVGIDLNVNSGISDLPVLTYGLMDAQVGYHTRFVREEKASVMVRKLYGNRISYGFDLLLNAVVDDEPGYGRASRHLWERFGRPVFNSGSQLAMPYAVYLEQVRNRIFFPVRDKTGELYKIPGGFIDPPLEGYEDHGSWIEWESNGEKMGGFRCAAPFWTDVINNSVFWNQARDAVGMYYWGREQQDSLLVSRARMIINFCLNAPRNDAGLFSTVFSAKDKAWGIGWSDPPHGKNVLFLRDAASYEIPALCKTGAHLLDYYMRAEKDERIISYLTPFANWLLTVIDDRGTLPSYVTDNMELSPILYESAQPAAGMWFLAAMYNVTKQRKYLDGAQRIGTYISTQIIPTAKWIDMEQYVSCGQKPFTMIRDEWQGQWFRGNLCVDWAAEGFAALYEATHNRAWLEAGEKCIDYLSFTQSCWSPNFVYTANPFGGFSTDNGDDAALMDQRQADFVKAYIYYGLKLNRADLLERGVAAGRAACVLIHNKRHVENGITTTPLLYPEGMASENIDHEGISQWPMRTHPLWGEGIAVFTGLSEIRRRLGGLYIDLDNDIVVGADGVKVLSDSRSADGKRKIQVGSFMSAAYYKHPYEQPFTIDVVIHSSRGQKLLLNGDEVGPGRIPLVIPPGN